MTRRRSTTISTQQESESASLNRGADSGHIQKKAKKRRVQHVHIGPNARAFRRGMAFCPMCDAERISRLTDFERDSIRAKKFEGRKGQ